MTDNRSSAGHPYVASGASRLAFERIEIRRVPGFERRGFELRELSPGVNLIQGPQAAGKSTTSRVLAGLLWPDDPVGIGRWEEASVSATVRLDGRRWEIDAAHARPRYQEEGEPRDRLPVPGGELSDRYSLALHDLLQAGADDGSFARLISRELAGGFDLDAALREVGAREKPGRPKNRIEEYKKAVRGFREAEDQQVELAAREAELGRLRTREAQARAAARQLEEIEAVLVWKACGERLAEAEHALADDFGAVGPAMERVSSWDLETLDRLEARLGEAELDLERKREAMRRAEARLREADLPVDGASRATLAALDQEQASLLTLEATIGEGESALARFRRLRQDARRAFGDGPEDEILRGFPADDWAPLVELATDAERLRGRKAQLDGLEDWLGTVAPRADLPRLTEGTGRLRSWLRCSVASWWRVAPALVASGLLAVVGAWGGARVDPGLWGLTALAVALAIWAIAGRLRDLAYRRSTAGEYAGLGLEEPERWTAEEVETLLARLESQRTEALLEAEKGARFREVQAQLERLDAKEAELARRRRELVAVLGLAPAVSGDPGDAPLATLAQALCAWRVADAEVRGKEAELAERRAERERKLAAASRLLVPFGYPTAESAAQLGGQARDLEARESRRVDASEQLRELTGEGGALERAERVVEDLRAERDRLFTDRRLEPGDRGGLARLVERLPAWRDAVEKARTARRDLERAESVLPEGQDFRAREPDELEEQREALAEQAGEVESLIGEIRVVEDRARRARAGTQLEDALARREDARLALRSERERDADAAVADELGRWLRESLQDRRRPQVMSRADHLFKAFTRGRYRLLDPAGEQPALRALETRTGLGRSLSELSSGTRLQLLLAVRIAYIEEQERGIRLPLVLDDTLANSDEWASREIIEVFVDLAREGRQIFYLTPKAEEIVRWQAALETTPDGPDWRPFDLAEVRRLEEAQLVPRVPVQSRSQSVPVPQGLSREEYGDALRVPGIDPWGDPGAVHLWHLVTETEVLYALLAEGIQNWGQLRALAETGRTENLVGKGAGPRRRRLFARARCVEVLCRVWRQGRGRPVERGTIVASGAVSDTFLERVGGLVEELRGSAEALIDALRSGGVKRFPRSKIDELEEYLEAEGYLDARDPLDEADLRVAALRDLAAEIETGHLSAEDVNELLALVLGWPRAS